MFFFSYRILPLIFLPALFYLHSLAAVEIKALVVAEKIELENDFSEAEGVISHFLPASFLEHFLGAEITETVLENLRKEVIASFEKEGHYAVAVSFPEQDVSSGVVMLQVDLPKIKSVRVSGNRWQTASFYEKEIGVFPGDPLETSKLLNQVAWFNRNPFRYAELVIAPGNHQAEVDVELLVKDRFSLRPFVGADNTGTNLTDEVRLFAGATWGRAFGRADVLNYQYTAAPNPSQFYAHTGSYLIFLPWKHEVNFFGGFSAVHPTIPGFTHEGISVQTSLRYGIPIGDLYSPKIQTFSWGADYKNINSNVFFIEQGSSTPVVANQANIFQFYLSYAWKRDLLFKLELFGSPFQWLPNQTEQRYQQLRPHSLVEYGYARLALSETYGSSNKFSFSWLLRAQGATGPLLPSEQFGLGGYDTIRGYKERVFLADNMGCVNVELRAPRLKIFRQGELIFLAFSDAGAGLNYQPTQEGQRFQYLWSAGVGARYQIASYLSLRADYGVEIHHILDQNEFGRFHLGGSLSY